MKTKLALSMALIAALSACGTTSNASDLNDNHSTTSDLPHTILSCVETVGGAEVLDGRVEVKVGKDQFGQFDVEVTQKDFTGNDSIIGHFLAVQRFLPDWSGAPDLTFLAEQDRKKLGLTLWADRNAANTSNGKLVLISAGERRELEVRCDM
jgi:hypothetical protein